MTFVEAAIELLKREGGPLSVEILAERASSEGLLSRPSKNPLSAMKGRLTTELKRGDEARIIQIEGGMFALAEDDAEEEQPEAEQEQEAEEKPRGRRRRRRRRRRGGNGVEDESAEDESESEDEDDGDEDDEDDGDEADGDEDDGDEDDGDEDDGDEQNRRRAIAPGTPEEVELAELYSDESEVASAADRAEYSDELTADEDRPMLPAIKAERRGRRRGRDRGGDRDRGRGGKKRRDRDRGGDRDRDRDRDKSSEESVVAASDLIGQVAEVLSDGDRSMQWNQAASTLRKRANRSESVEDLAHMLRRAVLIEEATAARLGVAPRVCTRGKDRVSLGRRESADLYPLLSRLENDVTVALTHKLSALPSRKLEVVVAAYLEHTGHADIEWVKRVNPSSYATSTAPGGVEILISARAGAKPVDRRGVGELRAGVIAKKLRAGVLIAPQPLSPEAQNELTKEGPPISVLCGPPLVSALVDAGLGVATRTFTVRSLDDGFFDRL